MAAGAGRDDGMLDTPPADEARPTLLPRKGTRPRGAEAPSAPERGPPRHAASPVAAEGSGALHFGSPPAGLPPLGGRPGSSAGSSARSWPPSPGSYGGWPPSHGASTASTPNRP